MLNVSNQYGLCIPLADSIDHLNLGSISHKNIDDHQCSLFFFIKLHYI